MLTGFEQRVESCGSVRIQARWTMASDESARANSLGQIEGANT